MRVTLAGCFACDLITTEELPLFAAGQGRGEFGHGKPERLEGLSGRMQPIENDRVITEASKSTRPRLAEQIH
jgi:hypothetical protein